MQPVTQQTPMEKALLSYEDEDLHVLAQEEAILKSYRGGEDNQCLKILSNVSKMKPILSDF